MSERFKEPVLKTGDGETHREFESHTLRQSIRPSGWVDFSQRGKGQMAVRLNENQEMVRTIREGLKKTGGYCPCRLERSEDNKCICKEFRDQIADPSYKGYCHCMLYYKD